MTPALTFLFGLALLILFGWYFATDYGARKRLLATILMVLLVAFSLATIYPPDKKIQLGLDIQGGTSFLIRLVGGEGGGDREITKEMLDQAVEVIRKRVDYFGGGEPVISPVGKDRILVQIPGLSTEKIQEARQQLSRVAKLEFRLVYPDNGEKPAGHRRRPGGDPAGIQDRDLQNAGRARTEGGAGRTAPREKEGGPRRRPCNRPPPPNMATKAGK